MRRDKSDHRLTSKDRIAAGTKEAVTIHKRGRDKRNRDKRCRDQRCRDKIGKRQKGQKRKE